MVSLVSLKWSKKENIGGGQERAHILNYWGARAQLPIGAGVYAYGPCLKPLHVMATLQRDFFSSK